MFIYIVTILQRKEYKIAVTEKSRTALSALYTAIKLLFFYIFLTVFSILKRRHILFLSPYSALSKIKGIIYNPVQKTQKNSSVENIPEKQMISGQE